MKKIMFTGGGSAGHVTVNIALFPRFLKDGWSVVYIGSENGIEKQLVKAKNIRYMRVLHNSIFVVQRSIYSVFKLYKTLYIACMTFVLLILQNTQFNLDDALLHGLFQILHARGAYESSTGYIDGHNARKGQERQQRRCNEAEQIKLWHRARHEG